MDSTHILNINNVINNPVINREPEGRCCLVFSELHAMWYHPTAIKTAIFEVIGWFQDDESHLLRESAGLSYGTAGQLISQTCLPAKTLLKQQ